MSNDDDVWTRGGKELSYLRDAAERYERERDLRRQRLFVSTTLAAASLCVALMAQEAALWALAAAIGVGVAAGLAWHLARARGDGARAFRVWYAWRGALSWADLSMVLVEQFVAWHPMTYLSSDPEIARRDLAFFRAQLVEGGIPDADRVLRAMCEVIAVELELRVEALKRRREVEAAVLEAAEIREKARDEGRAILDEAMRAAERVRAGDHAPIPAWMPLSAQVADLVEGRAAMLRQMVEQAAREAERGRVQESSAAAGVLKERTRWSVCVPSAQISESLMALFDPMSSPIPPPVPRDPDGTGTR